MREAEGSRPGKEGIPGKEERAGKVVRTTGKEERAGKVAAGKEGRRHPWRPVPKVKFECYFHHTNWLGGNLNGTAEEQRLCLWPYLSIFGN